MVQQLSTNTAPDIIYPDSDGKPMSDNTKQYQWIVKFKENLEILFAGQNDVFIAGDLMWYPVEGTNTICQAPDVMVAMGRPKGDRGSYQQWKEDNIPPQVVIEILSPRNSNQEMAKKLLFYQRYGVEEYYIYDPYKIEFSGLVCVDNWLQHIPEINGWVSPRLGIRFELTPDTLEIYDPRGRKFLTSVELEQLREQEYLRAEQERQAKETAILQLEQKQQEYQELLTKLASAGIDINNL